MFESRSWYLPHIQGKLLLEQYRQILRNFKNGWKGGNKDVFQDRWKSNQDVFQDGWKCNMDVWVDRGEDVVDRDRQRVRRSLAIIGTGTSGHGILSCLALACCSFFSSFWLESSRAEDWIPHLWVSQNTLFVVAMKLSFLFIFTLLMERTNENIGIRPS